MDPDRRTKLLEQLRPYVAEDEIFDDSSEIPVHCPFGGEQCEEANEYVRVCNDAELSFYCKGCDETGDIEKLLSTLKQGQIIKAERIYDADEERDLTDVKAFAVAKVERALAKHELKVHTLTAEQVYTPPPPPPPPPPKRTVERAIITLLALVFLTAGLGAAGLSGFANFTAFSSSVADPLQSKIWGWTGVIASIISFGGFTFFYWHTANRRFKEGVRSLLFALAGAITSIIGTQLYIANNNAAASSAATQATSNRAVLKSQLEDWRAQLDGIPADTRSVEGLQSYIAEVERVGRSHQKPYRDAQNELGLAKRRDDLQAKIESTNAELLGLGTTGIQVSAEERPSIPSWFFAIMLEIFSSQGTSIGFVALLILYNRHRDHAAA